MIRSMIKDHGMQALTTALLLSLIGIYTSNLKETKEIKITVIDLQCQQAASTAQTEALRISIRDTTAMLEKTVDAKCQAIEKMIVTLIDVLKNGKDLSAAFPEPKHRTRGG